MRAELEKFLAAEPFTPFQITPASGQSYAIRYPDPVMLGSDIMYLMNVHPDTHSVIRLIQISSIDTIV
jgi:hypothetical protein